MTGKCLKKHYGACRFRDQNDDCLWTFDGCHFHSAERPQTACEAVVPLNDLLCCKEWAYHYLMTKKRPSDKIIEYFDSLGWIKSAAPVGQYGWLADNPQDWAMMAAKILAAT